MKVRRVWEMGVLLVRLCILISKRFCFCQPDIPMVQVPTQAMAGMSVGGPAAQQVGYAGARRTTDSLTCAQSGLTNRLGHPLNIPAYLLTAVHGHCLWPAPLNRNVDLNARFGPVGRPPRRRVHTPHDSACPRTARICTPA